MGVRRTAASVHRWAGLTLGMAGTLVAATGAGMLYRPQADAAWHLDRLAAPTRCARPASLDRVAAAARAAHPRAAIDSLRLRSDPAVAAIVRMRDATHVELDPCTAGVLRVESRWRGLFGTLEWLHRFRWLDAPVARVVAGTVAAAMALLLALGGLFLWWPLHGWRGAWRLGRGLRGRARLRDRHRFVGVLVLPLLLTIAVAGLPVAFDWAEAALYTLTGSTPIVRPSAPAVADDAIAYEAAWRQVRGRLSAAPVDMLVRPPARAGEPVEFYLTEPAAPHVEARSYAYADPATGRVLSCVPWRDVPAGQRLASWLMALHKGEVGGLAGQGATLLAMLGTLFLGYSGLRSWAMRRRATVPVTPERRMRIAAIGEEATGVRGFRLTPLDPAPLAAAVPGSHVEVRLPDGTLRHYSLTNGPDDRDHYAIAVRADAAGRGGSLAIHALTAGTELTVSAPRDHFPIAADTREALLVAAGIGITPILSMARHLCAKGVPVALHYVGRSAEGMAYRNALPTACAATLHVGLPRAEVVRRLAEALAEPRAGRHIYVCGPAGFMEDLFVAARAAGWPESALHREAFAAATDARPSAPFDAVLAKTGRTIAVAADTTLLDALRAASVPVASSCEQGLCGTCMVRVVSGEIDHRDKFLTDQDRRDGDCMMACVSRAKGDRLVLDL